MSKALIADLQVVWNLGPSFFCLCPTLDKEKISDYMISLFSSGQIIMYTKLISTREK